MDQQRYIEELEVRIKQFQYGIYGALGAIVAAFIALAVMKKRTLGKIAAD